MRDERKTIAGCSKGRGRERGNIGGLGERLGSDRILRAPTDRERQRGKDREIKPTRARARERTRHKTSTRARARESGGWVKYAAGNKAGQWPMRGELAQPQVIRSERARIGRVTG
jgi:hypothetical protein